MSPLSLNPHPFHRIASLSIRNLTTTIMKALQIRHPSTACLLSLHISCQLCVPCLASKQRGSSGHTSQIQSLQLPRHSHQSGERAPVKKRGQWRKTTTSYWSSRMTRACHGRPSHLGFGIWIGASSEFRHFKCDTNVSRRSSEFGMLRMFVPFFFVFG